MHLRILLRVPAESPSPDYVMYNGHWEAWIPLYREVA